MDEKKHLKLTQEECFLLLTGARLFDKLVAGVTIHAEQKDELIREIIQKLKEYVPSQLEGMSSELADAIVESVLGCEDLDDTELEELELAYLDNDIEDLWGSEFFNELTGSEGVRQLSIDGLDVLDSQASCQSRDTWPPFEQEPLESAYDLIGKSEESEGRSRLNVQFEKYFNEETFAYPMYSVDDKLPILEKALVRHQSVSLNYYSVARETVDSVNVDPLVILQEEGMWLLVAYCHERDDILIFRVDRMKDVAETDQRFETPEDINELRCRVLATYK